MMNAKVHLYIRNDNVTVKIKKWVESKINIFAKMDIYEFLGISMEESIM